MQLGEAIKALWSNQSLVEGLKRNTKYLLFFGLLATACNDGPRTSAADYQSSSEQLSEIEQREAQRKQDITILHQRTGEIIEHIQNHGQSIDEQGKIMRIALKDSESKKLQAEMRLEDDREGYKRRMITFFQSTRDPQNPGDQNRNKDNWNTTTTGHVIVEMYASDDGIVYYTIDPEGVDGSTLRALIQGVFGR